MNVIRRIVATVTGAVVCTMGLGVAAMQPAHAVCDEHPRLVWVTQDHGFWVNNYPTTMKEGTGPGWTTITFEVQSSAGCLVAGSVDYSTAAKTASFNVDYTSKQGTLSWEVDDKGKRYVHVPIARDDKCEADEKFGLRFFNVKGFLDPPDEVIATIVDDDCKIPH
jgi:Calx-beta domain